MRQTSAPVGGGNDSGQCFAFPQTCEISATGGPNLHRGLEFYAAKLRAPDKRLHLELTVTERAFLQRGVIIDGRNIGRIGVVDLGDVKHKDPSRELVSDLNGILQPGQSASGEIDRDEQFIDLPDRLAQDEYRTGRMLRHAFRCAAQKEMLQPGSAMSRHDNQVRLHRVGHLTDLIENRRALLDITIHRRYHILVCQLFQIVCQPPACLIEKGGYRFLAGADSRGAMYSKR